MNSDDWEHYVKFEGWMSTSEVVNNHYTEFLEPIVTHFVSINLGGQALCYQSIMAVLGTLEIPKNDLG